MRLIESLAHETLATCGSFPRIDVARPAPAQRLAKREAGRSGRGVKSASCSRLMKFWVGLYSPPPRRLGTLL